MICAQSWLPAAIPRSKAAAARALFCSTMARSSGSVASRPNRNSPSQNPPRLSTRPPRAMTRRPTLGWPWRRCWCRAPLTPRRRYRTGGCSSREAGVTRRSSIPPSSNATPAASLRSRDQHMDGGHADAVRALPAHRDTLRRAPEHLLKLGGLARGIREEPLVSRSGPHGRAFGDGSLQ
jgi:hypothetical protein